MEKGYNMTTQTVEREIVVYTKEFLDKLKELGIEIPNKFKYKKTLNPEDDGW